MTEAEQTSRQIRSIHWGMLMVLALAVAAEAITVLIFVATRSFDTDGFAVLLGGTAAYVTAAWLSLRTFRRDLQRLRATELQGASPEVTQT